MRECKEILDQAISESRPDGPPPTAHASPGGIRDKAVREIVVRKPALNEFPEDTSNSKYGSYANIIQYSCVELLYAQLKSMVTSIPSTVEHPGLHLPPSPPLDLFLLLLLLKILCYSASERHQQPGDKKLMIQVAFLFAP